MTVNYISASVPDQLTAGLLMSAQLDVTGAAVVQVESKKGADGKPVLWVNVNGICLLRICRIQHLDFPDVHAEHWKLLCEAAGAIAQSELCGPKEADTFCQAIDNLSAAIMNEKD
jgi:hypothetical protein